MVHCPTDARSCGTLSQYELEGRLVIMVQSGIEIFYRSIDQNQMAANMRL